MSMPVILEISIYHVELRGCGANSKYVFYTKHRRSKGKSNIAGQYPTYLLPFLANKTTIKRALEQYALTLD